jgi:integrase
MESVRVIVDMRRKTSRGYPVRISVAVNGKTTYLTTGLYSDGRDFSKGRFNKRYGVTWADANGELEKRCDDVRRKLREMIDNGSTGYLGISEIHDRLSGHEIRHTLTIGDYESRHTAGLSQKTRESYGYMLSKLHEFNPEIVRFEQIDFRMLSDFDSHMNAAGIGINTRAIVMRNLRALFNAAINEEVIPLSCYPFRRFRIKTQAKIKQNLSAEEIRRLIDFVPLKSRMTLAKDLWLLSFYLIGVNPKDLFFCGKPIEGRIKFLRSKTGRPYDIKVYPEAEAIIDKYAGQSHLLRFVEDGEDFESWFHNLEHAARLIKQDLGFDHFIFYDARYSWATIASSLGIQRDTIAHALGHGLSTVTDIYIDFDLSKVDEANSKVIDALGEIRDTR